MGRIRNNHERVIVVRGEEAGCFEYGGSTVILCLEKGVARLNSEYSVNTDEEVRVRMGQTIGHAIFL